MRPTIAFVFASTNDINLLCGIIFLYLRSILFRGTLLTQPITNPLRLKFHITLQASACLSNILRVLVLVRTGNRNVFNIHLPYIARTASQHKGGKCRLRCCISYIVRCGKDGELSNGQILAYLETRDTSTELV
jgi:hypothetical protein